jgi:hypothetical protein
LLEWDLCAVSGAETALQFHTLDLDAEASWDDFVAAHPEFGEAVGR